jgi:hypothetical protein
VLPVAVIVIGVLVLLRGLTFSGQPSLGEAAESPGSAPGAGTPAPAPGDAGAPAASAAVAAEESRENP